MPNWFDGYTEISGSKKDLLSFLRSGVIQDGRYLNPIIKGDVLIYSKDEVPEGMYVTGTDGAFIGINSKRYKLEKNYRDNTYYFIGAWDQAWGVAISPIVEICKRYNISIVIEGVEPIVGFEHYVHISSGGEVLENVMKDYDTVDYSENEFDEWGHPVKIK
ncbi:hypothetical protein [Psychrobacillus sp. L4]|uniref:hypothetical protein n=1 Tax=Psychrobacillus sp. L4 TaxID=3236892 RepID=UPI0036F3467F